jgi:hypothetical protein
MVATRQPLTDRLRVWMLMAPAVALIVPSFGSGAALAALGEG